MAVENKDNVNIFESEVEKLRNKTGNNIKSSCYFADEISNLIEKKEFNKWPSFEICYKRDLTPFNDGDATIYSIYASIYDLYNSFNPFYGDIFSGNIRFYNPKSVINQGICDSLINDKKIFHLLNNGITIVCSKANNVTTDEKIAITRGSIINGAQTVGCINKVITDCIVQGRDIEEYKKSYVFVKIIVIADKKELINKLVYTLNTQNKTVNSYGISNDTKMKSIQKEINKEKQFYLELKPNEFIFVHDKKEKLKFKDKIISIDLAIQCFAAFYNFDDLGYLSKNNKSSLFDDNNINRLMEEIEKDKIIKSVELYKKIYALIKSYRTYLRDGSKSEILNNLHITDKDIDNYSFINTGDFLILFACGEYERKYEINSDDHLYEIIKIISKLIDNSVAVANQTRTKDMFDKVKDNI